MADNFRYYSVPGRSATAAGAGFFASAGGIATGVRTRGSERCTLPLRSSHLPKIIFPAVVYNTDVTETSMVFPIILRALSTTTMVPSSR